jgi:cyclase
LPLQHEKLGAGEILLNSIDKDGTFTGYDLALIQQVSQAVNIPVIALGGATTVTDFAKAKQAGASAVSCRKYVCFSTPT